MSADTQHLLSEPALRPGRRFIRVRRECLCEVIVDGLSIEGRTLDLNERGMAVVLPEPLFARLDATTIVLTRQDGSLCRLSGSVIRQHRIGVGEVLVGIRLAELPIEATTILIEKCAPASPFDLEPGFTTAASATGLLRWFRLWRSAQTTAAIDRRRIPRLPIHTVCTIIGEEGLRGLTYDLSYTGFSALFRDFEPGRFWGALLRIKFVTLRAMPIGIDRRGAEALVRFRVEQLLDGEDRWRDLHYSYWRHLS